jgi:hypothetical protein
MIIIDQLLDHSAYGYVASGNITKSVDMAHANVPESW